MLDGPHREVIELALFGDLTQREISERTGMPLGTVKTRTASAYKSLRKDLVAQGTHARRSDELHAQSPQLGSLPLIKTRSKEPIHPYNTAFSEANRNESQKGREVKGLG
jgi:hypothetical protein